MLDKIEILSLNEILSDLLGIQTRLLESKTHFTNRDKHE